LSKICVFRAFLSAKLRIFLEGSPSADLVHEWQQILGGEAQSFINQTLKTVKDSCAYFDVND